MGLAREGLDNINKQNAPLELLDGAKAKLESINTEVKAFLEDEQVYELVRESTVLRMSSLTLSRVTGSRTNERARC
jgi:hypothetical protein